MDDMEILIKGALLHDVGKVCYRASRKAGNHSMAGSNFLENYLDDSEASNRILNCVRYHHGEYLKKSQIKNDDLAYLVYEADNIAAAMDRRKNEGENQGYSTRLALNSVFNIFDGKVDALNENKYDLVCENKEGSFNYPSKKNIELSVNMYQALLDDLKVILAKYDINTLSANQILQIIEKVFRYVPSSTNIGEVCDISLYIHCKVTAAVASCMLLFYKEKEKLNKEDENDYKKVYFSPTNVKKTRTKKMYRIISGDISGIQNFIYTIPSKGALKSLRGRSFYLEIFLENFIDELLEKMNLSRANILYAGGGHFYLLAPATEEVKAIVDEMHKACNKWLLKHFGINLYLAMGFADYSANGLMQKDVLEKGSIFSNVNAKVNQDKVNSYDEELLKELFTSGNEYILNEDKSRECSICHNSSLALESYDDDKMICPICAGLYKLGENILKNDNMFLISTEKKSDAMPIFGFNARYYLYAVNEEQLKDFSHIVRIYSKNTVDFAKNTTNLWIADYCAKNDDDSVMTFDELAESSCKKNMGIKRLGVLRADVDNLGTAFISGFIDANQEDKFKYATISRYANLSEDLTMFFKYAVNNICAGDLKGLNTIEEKPFNIFGFGKQKTRNIHVVYSGGDDVFLVGAWDDLLEVAVDIYRAFKQFTNGKLTFSAGIALFTSTYPISKMAEITGMLEDASKKVKNKDSISLFGFETSVKNNDSKLICKHTYKWNEFIDGVWHDKLIFILGQIDFNNNSATKLVIGKTAVYNFMKLIQLSDNPDFNLARFAYVLARMQPKEENRLGAYNRFIENMYKWIRNPQDKKQLNTALNLLVYYLREK